MTDNIKNLTADSYTGFRKVELEISTELLKEIEKFAGVIGNKKESDMILDILKEYIRNKNIQKQSITENQDDNSMTAGAKLIKKWRAEGLIGFLDIGDYSTEEYVQKIKKEAFSKY